MIVTKEQYQAGIEILGLNVKPNSLPPMIGVSRTYDTLVKNGANFTKMTNARMDVLLYIISKKLSKGQKIHDFSFTQICTSCKGIGFDYKTRLMPVHDKCPKCFGSGVKTRLCNLCNGSGRRYINKGKHKFEVDCSSCKGTGYHKHKKNKHKRKEDYQCTHCGGSGNKDKLVISEIIDYKICDECRGSGTKVLRMTNPLFSADVLKKLT